MPERGQQLVDRCVDMVRALLGASGEVSKAAEREDDAGCTHAHHEHVMQGVTNERADRMVLRPLVVARGVFDVGTPGDEVFAQLAQLAPGRRAA